MQASAEFYRGAFGWDLSEPSGPLNRREWLVDGRPIAGLLPRPAAMPAETPVYWDTYFGTADPDAAITLAATLGATVLMGPVDVEIGRIGVFADPTGAVVQRARASHHYDRRMTMSVNGKIALVTGAGSGLGEAGAKRLAREGAKLIVADRNAEAVERVASEIASAGGDATPFVADVSVFEDTRRLVDFAVQTYGQLDIAFNNAGITPALSDVHEVDPGDWLAVDQHQPHRRLLLHEVRTDALRRARRRRDREHGLDGRSDGARRTRRLLRIQARDRRTDPVLRRRVRATQHPDQRRRAGTDRRPVVLRRTARSPSDHPREDRDGPSGDRR